MQTTKTLELLTVLVMAHFLADFGLQNDRMAVEKCPGMDKTLPWQWWLCSHSAIHGFFVATLTGLTSLGLCEWALHAIIDFAKCRRCYDLKVDQALHLSCKIAWAILATR